MGAELGNEELVEAWREARGERSGSSAKSVVTRFEGLQGPDRHEAFREIRQDYVSAGRPRRDNHVYRITVNDPENEDDDHLVLRVDISWEGRLPGQANVVIVTDQQSLGNAYGQPDCIFREVLDFEPERLRELLAAQPDDQVLAFNPLGASDPRPVTHRARLDGDGIARFDNDEIRQAHIKLSLSYPVPRGTPTFIIKLGEYAVPGPAEFTLTLNSPRASRPRAFAFLPPGSQREWASNPLRSNELFISLGTASSVLGEGDGVVLSWTVT
jgi:hypothetical protein